MRFRCGGWLSGLMGLRVSCLGRPWRKLDWAASPSPGSSGLQEAATPVMDDIVWFHTSCSDIITIITLFVLALLVIVIVKFNARANPVPSQDNAQYAARGGLDGDPGADPGHHRGAVVPPAVFQLNIPPADLT